MVDPQFIRRGLSAGNQQDCERLSFLAADQCTVAYLTLRTLFMQGMSGNINRLSIGRCVPPSVYIGFRLFVSQTCLA